MDIQPETYGLPSKTQLRELGANHVGIVKLRKSRIIQKDAANIVEAARRIKVLNPHSQVSLICRRNICSKSLALLAAHGIGVVYEDVVE